MSNANVSRGKTRWNSIDCIKGLACIAIVLIHYNFPGDLGGAVKAFCRFGVPIFFITSGFFFLYDGKMNDARTVNKIRHIFKMALWAGLFYAVFCVFENTFNNSTWEVEKFVVEKITADRLVKFFITNDPFVYSHLWFLLALIYCYVFAMLFFHNEKNVKLAMYFAPILILMHNVLQEFAGFNVLKTSVVIPGTENRLYLFNLFIFRALPFFLCGILFKKYVYIIRTIPFNKWALWLFFMSGGMIAVFERFTFKEDQFFLGNYVMVAALCIYAIKYPEYDNKVLKYIGKELSLYVYIFHIAVGRVLDLFARHYEIKETLFYQYSRAAMVLTGSLLVAFLINQGKKICILKIRSYKNRAE